MEEKEESRSTDAPKADEALAPITFHHSSDKYRKVAPVAAVVVAVGAFLLSMVGDGEPNYDIMTAGAFGCCSLFNVAFISQAIYQQKLIQHHVIYGGEKKGSKLGYIASVLLAFFGMAILLGNLFSSY
tara:strand:+ start:63 stop:446 length:384 start_codon:yes stop_codon:yes gene_type:complete